MTQANNRQALQGIARTSINEKGFDEFQKKFPFVWKRAEGIHVWDLEDNKYLDSTSGWFSANMGHNHPLLTQALLEQARKFWGVSSGFSHEAREKFVCALTQEMPSSLSKVIIGSSGAEANEIAIQLIRECSGDKGIIAFTGSFHGKTYATRHLGGNESFRKHLGVSPSPIPIYRVEYPYPYRAGAMPAGEQLADYCLAELARCMDDSRNPMKNIGALIAEPAQGVGGFIMPPQGFLAKIRDFCTKNDIIMVADEVITGFGRCGPLFYSTGQGVIPDILVTGKGIANGLPMSAVIVDEAIFSELDMKGGHINHYSSTTSGNPLCCSVAAAALALFREENFSVTTAGKGDYLRQKLEEKIGGIEEVGQIRGTGLMIGIELVKNRKSKEPAKETGQLLYEEALKRGLIINVGGSYGNVVKLAPPLIITQNQMDELIETLTESIKAAVKARSK